MIKCVFINEEAHSKNIQKIKKSMIVLVKSEHKLVLGG